MEKPTQILSDMSRGGTSMMACFFCSIVFFIIEQLIYMPLSLLIAHAIVRL